eukprot:TRINITY_DN12215_c0_g2_i1.p2 TRINITY_DN12215_c0_g2~~TRINITY_DN12215_c0_g2_i1.p2  ORF type:complete len:112 (+),score=9.20 TRINITY_DN12215_c0_g2_i1:238-573(+)
MANKSEVPPDKFNGKNYFSWEFQFQLFVKGKELWGHIDGTVQKPSDKDKYRKWETNDAKIMSWITSYVDQEIVINLSPYKIAKDMWEYLNTIYNQDNTALQISVRMCHTHS